MLEGFGNKLADLGKAAATIQDALKTENVTSGSEFEKFATEFETARQAGLTHETSLAELETAVSASIKTHKRLMDALGTLSKAEQAYYDARTKRINGLIGVEPDKKDGL